MELVINEMNALSNLNPELVESELRTLGSGEFATLYADENVFVQALIDDEDGILLEHREGSDDAHFSTVKPLQTVDQIIPAFVGFLNEANDWKKGYEWEKVEFVEIDFVVVALANEKKLDSVDNPFDLDAKLELPHVSMNHLSELARLISNPAESNDNKVWFSLFDKKAPNGLDDEEVEYYLAAKDLEENLLQVSDDAKDGIARNWFESEGFPVEEYSFEETSVVLTELIALVHSARENELRLIACYL